MCTLADAAQHDLDQLAGLFQVLSDPTRLALLALMSVGEKNVTSLCAQTRVPQPTVSHHLSIMLMHSLIAKRRQGRYVYYSLNGRTDVQPSGGLCINTPTLAIHVGPCDTGAVPAEPA